MKLGVNSLGAVALCVWTLAGLYAWGRIAQQTANSSDEPRTQASPEVAALADEVSTLHGDLQALSGTLAQNLQNLQDNLDAGERERAAAMARDLAALRAELRHGLDEVAAAAQRSQASEAPAVSEREQQSPAAQAPTEENPATANPG